MYPGKSVGFPDKNEIALVLPLPAFPRTPILNVISGVPGDIFGLSNSPKNNKVSAFYCEAHIETKFKGTKSYQSVSEIFDY